MTYVIQTDDIVTNATSTWCREHSIFMDYVTPQSLYDTKEEAQGVCDTVSKKVCYAFCDIAVKKLTTGVQDND